MDYDCCGYLYIYLFIEAYLEHSQVFISFNLFINYSLIIHSPFYLLISVYGSRVYILAASRYYSHVLACFIIFV